MLLAMFTRRKKREVEQGCRCSTNRLVYYLKLARKMSQADGGDIVVLVEAKQERTEGTVMFPFPCI
jgi:predicted secreted protein